MQANINCFNLFVLNRQDYEISVQIFPRQCQSPKFSLPGLEANLIMESSVQLCRQLQHLPMFFSYAFHGTNTTTRTIKETSLYSWILVRES